MDVAQQVGLDMKDETTILAWQMEECDEFYFSRERLRRVLRKKAAVILHLHTFTSADLHLHTFTSADLLHTLTPADLDLHTFTSSHPHICRSTSSHPHMC